MSTTGENWFSRFQRGMDDLDSSTVSPPRFEIQGKLGEGATSTVYRGWDRELKRAVAIKVLTD